jgi:cell division protein FtsI/penicillin-binding protein 2
MEKRINFLGIVVVCSFSIVLFRLFYLIILKGEYYTNKLSVMTNNVVLGDSTPRGRIYDRNMNLLVDNKCVPVIYYNDVLGLSNKEKIKYIYLLVEHIFVDFKKVTELELKDFLIEKAEDNLNSRIFDYEWDLYDNRKLSEEDIYNLKLERISSLEIENLSEKDLMVAYIFSLINNGYYYEDKVIKNKDITDLEIAYISENYVDLGGFNIKYNWERVYLYGDTFRSLLGNISKISKEDKDYYLGLGYSLDDIVGSSFLEKQYEDLLHGKKSKYEIINNKLKLIEDGERGKDIVLTIDINLQMKVDKILEEELIFAKKYGGIGCAIAVSGALLLGQGIIMNVYYSRVQHFDIKSFWKEILRMSIVPILLTVVAIGITSRFEIDTWTKWVISIAIYCIIYIPLFWVFSMNQYERAIVVESVRKIISKFRRCTR